MEKLWWPEYTLPDQEDTVIDDISKSNLSTTDKDSTNTNLKQNSNPSKGQKNKNNVDKLNEKVSFSLDEISKINEVEKIYNLMLEHSVDYQSMTKAMQLLQNQKEQVVEAIHTIENQKEDILKAPLNYIKKLKSNQVQLLPTRFKILDLPNINFDNRLELLDKYVKTKGKEKDTKLRTNKRSATNSNSTKRDKIDGWSEIELQQLHSLLECLPKDIDFEDKIEKLTTELKTKTTVQITEYLINNGYNNTKDIDLSQLKHKSELKAERRVTPTKKPRMLRNDNGSKLKTQRRLQPKPSIQTNITRFPTNLTDSLNGLDSSSETSSSKLSKIDPDFHFNHNSHDSEAVIHIGYRCFACQIEPIVGLRWTCTICESLHLCDRCKLKPLGIRFQQHNLQHKLIPTKEAVTNQVVDLDYQVEGNYLLEG